MNSFAACTTRSTTWIALSLALVPICVRANSAVPLVDSGFKGADSTVFDQANAAGDQDLIVVREKFFGAEGVDLNDYGLGSPDFVQSILFRPGPAVSADGQTRATVTFTGAKIHGFIIGTDPSGADPLLMQSNGIFGVTTGLLQDGIDLELNPLTDFITLIDEHTFAFGARFSNGFDDFRVIIDYGDDEFSPTASFEVKLDPVFTTSLGIQVGDAVNPTVQGSGDFGEVVELSNIPLITAPVDCPCLELEYFSDLLEGDYEELLECRDFADYTGILVRMEDGRAIGAASGIWRSQTTCVVQVLGDMGSVDFLQISESEDQACRQVLRDACPN